MLTPLPPYIASNLTDAEFQNLLDRSDVPAYVRERFGELIGYREQCEQDETTTEKELDDANSKISEYADKTELLRKRWDALVERLHPDGGDAEDVVLVESTIDAMEELGPV